MRDGVLMNMRVIYNRLLPVRPFIAIMLFGVIFARIEYRPLSYVDINHERIHRDQARRCGGYVKYYVKYVAEWTRKGYLNNKFEVEAYANERNLGYKVI